MSRLRFVRGRSTLAPPPSQSESYAPGYFVRDALRLRGRSCHSAGAPGALARRAFSRGPVGTGPPGLRRLLRPLPWHRARGRHRASAGGPGLSGEVERGSGSHYRGALLRAADHDAEARHGLAVARLVSRSPCLPAAAQRTRRRQPGAFGHAHGVALNQARRGCATEKSGSGIHRRREGSQADSHRTFAGGAHRLSRFLRLVVRDARLRGDALLPAEPAEYLERRPAHRGLRLPAWLGRALPLGSGRLPGNPLCHHRPAHRGD